MTGPSDGQCRILNCETAARSRLGNGRSERHRPGRAKARRRFRSKHMKFIPIGTLQLYKRTCRVPIVWKPKYEDRRRCNWGLQCELTVAPPISRYELAGGSLQSSTGQPIIFRSWQAAEDQA